MSYTSNINNIRFGGMASGLDTEKIVKQLMRLEQRRVDRIAQEKQILEWKRSGYREINTKLLALRNAAFDLRLQSNFLGRKAVSSSESVVQASGVDAGGITGNYKIEVEKLATGASYQAAVESNFAAQAGTLVITGSKGSAEISLEEGEGAKQAAARINAYTNTTGIRAVYDENLNRFFLMSVDTGSSAVIKVKALDDGGAANLAGLLGGAYNVDEEVTLSSGQDAQVKINDGEVLTFSSNQIKVLGMSLVLKGEGVAQVTVSQDIDRAVEKIKAFVEAYNEVMEKINTRLTEKRYRDYPPLTEEQKKELKEKEIELWEEKARSGLLNADPLLSSIASGIRMTVMDAVPGLEGKYKTLSSLGITTLSWNDKGKLYVNEEKLRNALSEDLEGVMSFFTNSSGNGMAQKVYEKVNSAIRQIVDKAGRDDYKVDNSLLGKEILQQEKKMAQMQEKLAKIEEKYWRQFTAMEKALAKMQSQGDWLMMHLSAGK
ncbi:flagellar hook-associated protein 2 [Thermosyntropha lipolytica DSM 11003]|uniref:Flagellar hook-associated protein 2 n=1 Tax=Thermosyntropha lipolytica DSM 11003 TaxID=1123382 RepID=A0A1M5KN23_9FIRM|nr:flagellar filament capping protein FliD [Thermosyntropha lipolytica]SHG54212.1 flagellar hook-associated protein 2 [Thermosyntropha lipolytica DSM 11003]